MIYKYTIYGKVRHSDRKILYTASIPLGLSIEDLWDRIMAFGKAFDLLKFEIH